MFEWYFCKYLKWREATLLDLVMHGSLVCVIPILLGNILAIALNIATYVSSLNVFLRCFVLWGLGAVFITSIVAFVLGLAWVAVKLESVKIAQCPRRKN